jgi:ubiquinone/menaquinone biosynthesis C-methylase UbiE
MAFDPPNVQDHFEKLSRRWERLYEPGALQTPRIEQFTRILTEKRPAPGNVMDFGCGTGDISEALAGVGYSVIGVDASASMIERTNARASNTLRFQTIPTSKPFRLPFSPETFDAVVASSVLEYVSPLDECFQEIHRVTQRGGLFVFTVPNMAHRTQEKILRPLAKVLNRLSLTKVHPFFEWFEYMELSINRYPLERWQAMLSKAGWTCESAEGADTPLWLISARSQ